MSQRRIRTMADRFGPVGATIRSAYWGETYTVLSHNVADKDWNDSVTVVLEDGEAVTHRTQLGPRDVIVSLSA